MYFKILPDKEFKSFTILKKAIVLFFLFFCFVTGEFAQVESPYRVGKVKHRISLGPVLSFYKNNQLHTVNTKAKAGVSASYKAELILSKKANLLVGLEYLSQGFTFHGYYKAPFHTYLFDQTFSYYHEIRYQEIQLPFAMKVALNVEKDRPSTPYVFAGFGFRYITKSTFFIASDSTEETMYDGKGDLSFENHIGNKFLNAYFEGGLGLQKNFRDKGSAFFFELTYKYGVSRLHYTGYNNSNDLNISNANLTIAIGWRF